jgi:hypothetical protein
VSNIHAIPVKSKIIAGIYTYRHDNAITAVVKKLVAATAVDGHLWEYYQLRNDFYSDKTHVISKSEP